VSRGYLWENLGDEVAAEFDAVTPSNPLNSIYSRVDSGFIGWSIETPGRGIRPDGPQKTPTERVAELRAARAANGMCRDCGQPRAAKSKNYCEKHSEADRRRHREADQLRAAQKPISARPVGKTSTERANVVRAAHAANGLCRDCGQPRATSRRNIASGIAR
jgi:hypothetical protein